MKKYNLPFLFSLALFSQFSFAGWSTDVVKDPVSGDLKANMLHSDKHSPVGLLIECDKENHFFSYLQYDDSLLKDGERRMVKINVNIDGGEEISMNGKLFRLSDRLITAKAINKASIREILKELRSAKESINVTISDHLDINKETISFDVSGAENSVEKLASACDITRFI